jgi:hypothetical protein
MNSTCHLLSKIESQPRICGYHLLLIGAYSTKAAVFVRPEAEVRLPGNI